MKSRDSEHVKKSTIVQSKSVSNVSLERARLQKKKENVEDRRQSKICLKDKTPRRQSKSYLMDKTPKHSKNLSSQQTPSGYCLKVLCLIIFSPF